MTKQREQLQLLTEKLNYYQGEIQKLTMHPNGKSYGKCIRELIYKFIDPNYTGSRAYNMNPIIYAKYQKLHGKVSRITGNKSQVYTKDEYELAIDYMRLAWKYDIPKEYQIENSKRF